MKILEQDGLCTGMSMERMENCLEQLFAKQIHILPIGHAGVALEQSQFYHLVVKKVVDFNFYSCIMVK